MSIWSENPEAFDSWLEEQAERGRFDNTPYGPEIKRLLAAGDFCAWEWWDKLDTNGSLGQEAMTAYVERFIP